MLNPQGNCRLGVCGALLGAVYFGFAGSAMAWNEPLWVRQLGTDGYYDSGTGVATDAVGNVYVSGSSAWYAEGGPIDYGWLAKYDAAGRVLWKRQFDPIAGPWFSDQDAATGVTTDTAGNVYVSGWRVCYHETRCCLYDAWLAKYDAAGRVLWKQQLGTENSSGVATVATDAVGNVYVSGSTYGSLGGTNRGGQDAWVAKYNVSGQVLWKRQLGTEDDDGASGVATDAAGNVYLSGTRSAHKQAAWLGKYDTAGHVHWKRELGSESSFDSASGVATDAAGNVYVTGRTDGSLGGANRGGDGARRAKYNPAGDVLWKRQLGTEDDDGASGVAADAAGNVYVTGSTYGSLGGANRGGPDIWLAKYDAAGRVLWKRQFGTETEDVANGVTTDNAGNVYLTGNTGFPLTTEDKYQENWRDALVIKYSTQR